MIRPALAMLCALWLAPLGRTQSLEDAKLWSTDTDGTMESAWVVQVPAGSGDYFNVAHEVVTAPNTDRVSVTLPVSALGIAVADFGATARFPRAGVFLSNLLLDPTGSTPNLSLPLAQVTSPALAPGSLFDVVAVDLPDATIPSGTTRLHAVVQIPPGDSGQLALGADTNGVALGTSFSTENAYFTAGLAFPGNLGLNIGQDNGTSRTDGRLRVSGELTDRTGDRLQVEVTPGKEVSLAMFAPHASDKWLLYLTNGSCAPLARVGGVLPLIADPDGDGGYLRVGVRWPIGFGGQTFQFTAAYGDAIAGAHGFTNCITIVAKPELPFGRWDDGSIEDAWFVSLPTGSADYFSVDFLGPSANVKNVTGIEIAVLDFGAASPSFPVAGVAKPNTAIDPTGLTPDLSQPLAQIAPFTFPPGTMATTSGAYVRRPILPLPKSQLPSDTIAYVQFPPGDPGMLAIGADTDGVLSGYSGWSRDGFASPANDAAFANWGIRLVTN